jgi:hypothetical protein
MLDIMIQLQVVNNENRSVLYFACTIVSIEGSYSYPLTPSLLVDPHSTCSLTSDPSWWWNLVKSAEPH